MCRVAFRQPTRDRPAEAANTQGAQEALLYGQVRSEELKDDLDFEGLLGGTDEVDVDDDFDLLGMFDDSPATEGPVMPVDVAPSVAIAALGQPMLAPAPTAVPPAQSTLPIIGSHMPCTLPNVVSGQSLSAMPSLQQQYTQAILQQQMWAQLQTNCDVHSLTGVSKRGKTAAEVAEQQERIKRRRRESAQRSRQRKSAYMKTLECENHALKAENDILRRELSRLSGRPLPPPLPSCLTTSSSSAGVVKVDDPMTLYDQSSGQLAIVKSEGGLCRLDASGLGSPAANQLLGMVL